MVKTIQIPEELYETLDKKLSDSTFKSVEDFCVFILQSYLDKENNQTTGSEQKIIEERLRNLGYL